jgi:hypothetical protein
VSPRSQLVGTARETDGMDSVAVSQSFSSSSSPPKLEKKCTPTPPPSSTESSGSSSPTPHSDDSSPGRATWSGGHIGARAGERSERRPPAATCRRGARRPRAGDVIVLRLPQEEVRNHLFLPPFFSLFKTVPLCNAVLCGRQSPIIQW